MRGRRGSSQGWPRQPRLSTWVLQQPNPEKKEKWIIALEGIFHLIEFQMSFLLFIALAGYLVASRVNQSAVIGEIVVGLIVGPSVLGIITYTDFVSSIAHLGAVVLLFVVGLEFRLEDIAKPRYFVIASSGVVVPWIMGYFASRLFGFALLPFELHSLAICLLEDSEMCCLHLQGCTNDSGIRHNRAAAVLPFDPRMGK